jgi:retron-type reverse transcriptase
MIPKADGKQRPLAIAALEDKIVQKATLAVLNSICEEDFLGFSCGFRPKRSQHDALDALTVGITAKRVNFILVSESHRSIAVAGDGKAKHREGIARSSRSTKIKFS